MNAVALGFRTHSGWASAVAVTRSAAGPAVLDRRRIVLADFSIRGSKQPFHAAEPMDFPHAEAMIHRCRESSRLLAVAAVNGLLDQVTKQGYRVAAAGIVIASGRPLPDLAAILKSHALIHTAEGEFYREALVRACEECSLPVTRIKERERDAKVWAQIEALGKSLGPPWRQDEKLASLAAWMALG